MATSSDASASFEEADTRSEEMHSTIEAWIDDLVSRLTEAAAELDVAVRIVSKQEWSHGEAKGVCKPLRGSDADALVKVKDRSNRAALAGTIIHEYAHAQLHVGLDDQDERAKREVEAEAVAYVVGRTSTST